MKTYEIHSHKTDTRAELQYCPAGLLAGVLFHDTPPGNGIEAVEARQLMFGWVLGRCLTEQAMLVSAKKAGWDVCEKVGDAPTFEKFWELYGLKKDRKRALVKWDRLKSGEKVKAVAYISKYKNWCKLNNRFLKEPKTYLNDENWND